MKSSEIIKRQLTPLNYVLHKMGGKVDRHKLFKVLYFADMNHIARFGHSITDDRYIAMKYGPVPSRLFDYIKAVARQSNVPLDQSYLSEIDAYFSTDGMFIITSKKPDMDFLSRTEIDSLELAIKNYGSKSFTELCEISHGSAWKSSDVNDEISEFEIAKEGGANDSLLTYMRESK